MKKVIFTLFLAASITLGYSQTTYYWVGGTSGTSITSNSNWNTGVGGTGTLRTAAATNDILIFDGYDVSADPGQQSGPVAIAFTGTITEGQIIFKNNIDVTFSRSSTGGTTTVNIVGTGDSDPDLFVQAGSKLTIAGTTGSMAVATGASATGEIDGDLVFGDNGNNTTNQNRLVSLAKGALVFMPGSTATTTANYGYNPFGSSSSSSTPAAASGVVFRAGSTFTYGGGNSPFGSASASLVDFQTGSTFVFTKAPTGVSSIWSNRIYPNVKVQNNITLNPDATFVKMDTLTIDAGSTFLTNTSGSTPINGDIINNGTFAVPAADPNRGNKLLMINSVPQTIKGTGTYNVGFFVISNVSNVALQKTVTVDSSTIIFGRLTANGFLAGSGTTIVRTAASYNVTGNVNVDSVVVKNISDLTGVEPGMSVSGTNIQPNTVVVSTSSTNGTITLSKAATGSTFASSTALTIFNGNAILPVKLGEITANLQYGQTRIAWKVYTENEMARYAVERSLDGVEFKEIGSVKANGGSQYNWIDISPATGSNYYRVKGIGNNGDVIYTNIVMVNDGFGKAEFSVYPNPVKGRDVSLQLNNLAKGNYTLNLFNNLGQKVFTKIINSDGGFTNETVTLPESTTAGLYRLVLTGDGTSLKQTLVVQ